MLCYVKQFMFQKDFTNFSQYLIINIIFSYLQCICKMSIIIPIHELQLFALSTLQLECLCHLCAGLFIICTCDCTTLCNIIRNILEFWNIQYDISCCFQLMQSWGNTIRHVRPDKTNCVVSFSLHLPKSTQFL